MPTNPIILAVYGLALFVILVVNMLYLFQVFRYRLPGDVSLFIVIAHLAVMLFMLLIGSLFIGF